MQLSKERLGGFHMFYIKENLNDTTSISVEINNENVYCHCLQCGAEVPVDLVSSGQQKTLTFSASAVYCDACTLKRLKGVLHESGIMPKDTSISLLMRHLSRIEREGTQSEAKPPYRPLVYICSPSNT